MGDTHTYQDNYGNQVEHFINEAYATALFNYFDISYFSSELDGYLLVGAWEVVGYVRNGANDDAVPDFWLGVVATTYSDNYYYPYLTVSHSEYILHTLTYGYSGVHGLGCGGDQPSSVCTPIPAIPITPSQ